MSVTTLNLEEAAEFLKMNPQVLRRKADSGQIPGSKPGKRWVFVKEHLADFVSGRYPATGQMLRVIDGAKSKQEKKPCPSINVAKLGGSTSPRQMDREYADLLAPKAKKKPKSCTTA